MEIWIPFFQSLIWPLFLGILLIFSRGWVKEMLRVIKERVEQGSEINAQLPGGISFGMGEAPKLEQPSPEQENKLLAKVEEQIATKEPLAQASIAKDLLQAIYLIHSATFFKQAGPSTDRRDFYTIKVQLSADSQTVLDKIAKVVYYRHPSFGDKTVLEVSDKESNFEMVTRVWGQFNLRAEIYFKDGGQPLTLYRYLNF
jgi:hypothetical protein